MRSIHAFLVRVALIAVVLAALVQSTAPAVAAATGKTEYDRLYATFYSKLGDRWKERARGPNLFDCSGLVWYSFRENSLAIRIGGYRSVNGYYSWFKQRGQVSKTNPRLGDLIIWGNNQHIGFYIGNGKAISTLTTRHGVSIHPVFGYLGIPFKAYLHTDITRP